MAKKQDTDSSGKSPVRTELADSTKKLGKLTVNVRKPISEEKGDLVETHEVMDQGQVVARYVKKDGEVLESSATADAQSAGIHEKAAKQAGVDKDAVVFTTPGMNAAEAEVEQSGSEDGSKPTDPMGEKAELSGKTKENKPKSKLSEGKKPDTSMSKMSKEKTGEADKDGDRDLSKDLEKTDKIEDMAERRRKAEEVMKKRAGKGSNMLGLLQTIKQMTAKPRNYDPADAAGLSSQIRDLYNTRKDAAKLDKSEEEPWHDPEQHASDQKFEALLEEKLKRHFGSKAGMQLPTIDLKKADDPAEAMRRMRVEHSVQHGLKGHTPAPTKNDGNRPVPKTPNYKLLTPMESNAKTAKNENVEGDEGQGHFSAILHLAPATLAGVGNVCTGATEGCKDSCLNTAGRGGMFKAGEDTNIIQKARIRKTKQLAQNPGKFMDDLVHDIHQVKRHADAHGKKAVVRLNGTSDIAWEDLKLPHFAGKNLFEAFPDIQFYDYTKRPDRVMKNKHANYHITFSRSDKNENVAKRLLQAGHNVAAVFGGKKLPKQWHGHPVISGDEHDLRFLDPKGGYVIGLKAKGEAQGDKSGFVVWGHEGDPTAVPKEQRGKLAGIKRVEKSEKYQEVECGSCGRKFDTAPSSPWLKCPHCEYQTKKESKLAKAKQEQYHSARGKRVIREDRRMAPKDPLADKKPGMNMRPQNGKISKILGLAKAAVASKTLAKQDGAQQAAATTIKETGGFGGSSGGSSGGGLGGLVSSAASFVKDQMNPANSMGAKINQAGATAVGKSDDMNKAMPAPATPSKPVPPSPPVVQQTPKRPKRPGTTIYATTAQMSKSKEEWTELHEKLGRPPTDSEFADHMADKTDRTHKDTKGKKEDAMTKGAKWPVPGKVPPKMPERPAQALNKFQDTKGAYLPPPKKPGAPVASAAPEKKSPDWKPNLHGTKPLNKAAACSAFLTKACGTMRKSKDEGMSTQMAKTGPTLENPRDYDQRKAQERTKVLKDKWYFHHRAIGMGHEAAMAAGHKDYDPPTVQEQLTGTRKPAPAKTPAPRPEPEVGLEKARKPSKNKSFMDKVIDKKVAEEKAPKQSSNVVSLATAKKPAPAAAPKSEGYDFEAAKKRYHELKAKQAEAIKNQDIKGAIKRSPRA